MHCIISVLILAHSRIRNFKIVSLKNDTKSCLCRGSSFSCSILIFTVFKESLSTWEPDFKIVVFNNDRLQFKK